MLFPSCDLSNTENSDNPVCAGSEEREREKPAAAGADLGASLVSTVAFTNALLVVTPIVLNPFAFVVPDVLCACTGGREFAGADAGGLGVCLRLQRAVTNRRGSEVASCLRQFARASRLNENCTTTRRQMDHCVQLNHVTCVEKGIVATYPNQTVTAKPTKRLLGKLVIM